MELAQCRRSRVGCVFVVFVAEFVLVSRSVCVRSAVFEFRSSFVFFGGTPTEPWKAFLSFCGSQSYRWFPKELQRVFVFFGLFSKEASTPFLFLFLAVLVLSGLGSKQSSKAFLFGSWRGRGLVETSVVCCQRRSPRLFLFPFFGS